jgi:PAS domain S-box-containing protein
MATKRISIALILSAALVTLITLSLSIFAVFAYSVEKSNRWKQLEESLNVTAEQLTVGLTFPIWNLDDKQTIAVMKSSMSNNDIHTVVTAMSKTTHILTRDSHWSIVEVPTIPDDHGLLVEKRTVYFGKEQVGKVSIYASPIFVEEEMKVKRLTLILFIVGLAIVLMSGLYLLIWYIVLKPLKAVDHYAITVKANSSAQPISHKVRFFGELKTLNESIQEMVSLLDSRYRAMKASEERLKLATRGANIGIWDWDVENDVLTWDEEMYRVYGIPNQGNKETFNTWRTSVLPEDLAQVTALIQAALDGHQEFTTEYRIRWPDGSIHFIQADSQTFRNGEGRPTRMVGVNYDITQRKLTELALKEYKENLEDLVRQRTSELKIALDKSESATKAKSKFLANMSHELRTPLNAVIGFSELMANTSKMKPEDQNNLKIINRSGHHLLTLINDILQLSKIEAGQMQVMEELVDLNDLIQDVMDMVRVKAAKANLELRLECDSLPDVVSVDSGKLRQILLNLLSNAVKFVKKGSITLAIQSTPISDDRIQLKFSVRDTGIGIAPEDQERIFEPFVQADTPATQAGTGLGLTISRDFVRLMGGELKVDSLLGTGSTFHFSIIVHQRDKSLKPVKTRQRVIGLPPNEQGKSILVVDDNHDARQLLVSLLMPLGFKVQEAKDGLEVQDLLVPVQPDLIFMDCRMPNMGGLEATQWVRSQTGVKQPRIIVLTASAFEEEKQEALNAGADEFMRKPVEQDKLYAILELQLGVHFIRQAADQHAMPTEQEALCDADIALLDKPMRDKLKLAVLELNLLKVTELLHVIAHDHPDVAQRLQIMLDQFQYTELWKLIDDIDVKES